MRPDPPRPGRRSLLLAALARRRRGRGERLVEHPLLLAALTRRHGEEGDGVMDHPLVLAALAR
jgi:uridine kinase